MSGRETVVTFANAFGTTRSTLAIQRVLPMCLASHKLQQHSDTTPRSLFLVIGTHRAKIGDPVGSTSQLRDLTASAARIFGWDSDKPGVQLNQQFVLTQEQIDRIREAADADDPYKKPATR